MEEGVFAKTSNAFNLVNAVPDGVELNIPQELSRVRRNAYSYGYPWSSKG